MSWFTAGYACVAGIGRNIKGNLLIFMSLHFSVNPQVEAKKPYHR